MLRYSCLLLVFLLIQSTIAAVKPAGKAPSPWLTLDGARPAVIARGGFSGLFPESSQLAYEIAQQTSLPDTIFYCDLQLTQDMVAFCLSDIRLDNLTNVAALYPDRQRTYDVNGIQTKGWFPVDFIADELLINASLIQNIMTRTDLFDETLGILPVDQVASMKPAGFWVNVPYDTFYHQHKLSPAAYLEETQFMGIQYISSPEINFLKYIGGKVDKTKIKLVFRFLDANMTEPTTKQAYGAILKNLVAVKEFATGILVPKEYIWPVNKNMYLEAAASTLVADAHKLGLQVYAGGFANDLPAAYNYSYDPTAEYLKFADNDMFSVDGFLTDFPVTASEAVACLAHNKNATLKHHEERALIISRNGASGDYAACTDLAYEKAVNDGADVIDCSVQFSKDGIAFCSDSADLSKTTNAVTMFVSKSIVIPEIQKDNGIYSFDLTWNEIQSLKPQLVTPYPNGLPRNPAYKDKGKLWTLTEFLDFAKTKAVTGVLINIENAAYLAANKGVDAVESVTNALNNATFDKQQTQLVFIQSDDTSVLAKFKASPTYKKVLTISEIISDAPKPAVDEIAKFADTVDLRKLSLVQTSAAFTTAFTKIIEQMHAANISVHVSTLYNDFITLPFDVFGDPLIELATYVDALHVDGVVTDYPATASAFMRSPCSDPNAKVDFAFNPIEAGALLHLAPKEVLPPASAPEPPLTAADIIDPPLPPVKPVAAPQPATDKPADDSSTTTTRMSSVAIYLAATLLVVLLSGF